MKSLEYLEREERQIESILEMLDYFSRRLDNRQDVPPYMFKEIIEFLRIYVDGHHKKREVLILMFLGSYGINTPNQECTEIHAYLKKYGRFLLKVIEAYDLGYQGAKGVLAYHAKRYIEILRQHLAFENELVARLVDDQERRDVEVLRQFKKVARDAKKIRERGIIRMDALKRESLMISGH